MTKESNSNSNSKYQKRKLNRFLVSNINASFEDHTYLFSEENSILPFLQENNAQFHDFLGSKGITVGQYDRSNINLVVAAQFYYKWQALDHIFDNLSSISDLFINQFPNDLHYENKVGELVFNQISVKGAKGIVMDYLAINKSIQLQDFLNHEKHGSIKKLVEISGSYKEQYGNKSIEYIKQYSRHLSYCRAKEAIVDMRRGLLDAVDLKFLSPVEIHKPESEGVFTDVNQNRSASKKRKLSDSTDTDSPGTSPENPSPKQAKTNNDISLQM